MRPRRARTSGLPAAIGRGAILAALCAVALIVGCGGLPPVDEQESTGSVVVMVVEEETNQPLSAPATVIVGGVRGTLKPSEEQLVLRDVPIGTGTPPTQPMTTTAQGYVTATRQVQLNVTTATWVTETLVAADTATTGTVSGTVTDMDTAEPIANAFAQFTPPGEDEPMVAGYTDADGEFVVGGIPSGRRRLTVQASGYLAHERPVTITADDAGENDPLQVELIGGDTTVDLRGTAVDVLTRDPIAGAEVTLGERDPVTTDADGAFTVPEVSVGEQPVVVVADGYERLERTISVLPGMDAVVLEMFEQAVDPPGGPFTLAGNVTLSGRPDSAGAEVTAVDLDSSEEPDSAVTDESGRYELFVPPGRYEVRVTFGERSLSRQVTVPEGGVVVDGVDFVLTVG